MLLKPLSCKALGGGGVKMVREQVFLGCEDSTQGLYQVIISDDRGSANPH